MDLLAQQQAVTSIAERLTGDAPPPPWQVMHLECWLSERGVRAKVTAFEHGVDDELSFDLGDREAVAAYLPLLEELYGACWDPGTQTSWVYALVSVTVDGRVESRFEYPGGE